MGDRGRAIGLGIVRVYLGADHPSDAVFAALLGCPRSDLGLVFVEPQTLVDEVAETEGPKLCGAGAPPCS